MPHTEKLLNWTPSVALQDDHMMLFSLHHGHTPAQPNNLLKHLRGLRHDSFQNIESNATMPKHSCKGSCSFALDTGSSQSNRQVTADSSGAKGSAGDSISSGSPDESQISDQRKIKSEQNTAEATALQTQATQTQQALFQDLDAILSTNTNSGILRRKVKQASPSVTCTGACCMHACLVRHPI